MPTLRPPDSTTVDHYLITAACSLDGARDLHADILRHVGSLVLPPYRYTYAALYACASRPGMGDHLAKCIREIADANLEVELRTRHEHEGPCPYPDCDTCDAINAQNLAEAVSDLRYLLGDRLCDDLQERVA
jgi:hypothetical protein